MALEHSPWELLSLPLALNLSQEDIVNQFRTLSKQKHPDAGGNQGDFERLREAHDTLKHPLARLDAWLVLHKIEIPHTGAVTEKVGQFFLHVNEAKTSFQQWQAKRPNAESALAKAIWQKEGFQLKSQLENLTGQVDDWEEQLIAQFSHIQEETLQGQNKLALQNRSELGFLKKWRQELQACYSQLWEGLI